jgi:6-phosphogluconolactonase
MLLQLILGLLTGVSAGGSDVDYRGGKNNIAVFSIDPEGRRATLVQHAHPYSFHVGTFRVDPSGKMMVAASIRHEYEH